MKSALRWLSEHYEMSSYMYAAAMALILAAVVAFAWAR